MGKTPIKINSHFLIITDEEGGESEVIYSPPLLAETQNIRVELRKEKNHNRPHVHVIKKGRDKSYHVSIALDDLEILAGGNRTKAFGAEEFDHILDFILNNQETLMKVYENLRGDL